MLFVNLLNSRFEFYLIVNDMDCKSFKMLDFITFKFVYSKSFIYLIYIEPFK